MYAVYLINFHLSIYLTHRDIIKVNQDRLGIQGIRLKRVNNIDVGIHNYKLITFLFSIFI